MTTRIREAVEADVPAIVAMGERFLGSSHYGDLFPPAPGRLEAVVRAALEHGVVLLAEALGDTLADDYGDTGIAQSVEVVGMLVLVALPHPFSGEVIGDELAWWVNPEHRGGRAGHKLLRSAEAWARQNGVVALKMSAPTDSDDSVDGYLYRTGYVAVETAYLKRLD